MGNFEKLSVLVIVVIIVMILVVALYTWTDGTEGQAVAAGPGPDVANLFSEPPPLKVDPAKAATPPAAEAPPLATTPTPEITPPPAPPPEPPKPTVREHVIASGDTLERISKHYYGSMRHIGAIEQANPGLDPMRLRLGAKIVLPDVKTDAGATAPADAPKPAASRRSLEPGTVYTVRRGDSLPEISRRTYGKIDRWHEIWLANFDRIDDPDRLSAGTRLNLPN
jgi:nucleoid-associated protein YgaU